tara:strand:+ start:745 stop:1512 length:768 start_codon:yes stop_codon:yes gene_type:complete
MKVVILAGGFGTRLSEYTDNIPKPMVEISGKPILEHILNIYSNFNYNDFVIALGYKGNLIKKYFTEYNNYKNDLTIDFKNSKIEILKKNKTNNWKISLVDTGVKTKTGGRLKRLKNLIGSETFMLTYGDGLCNVNIDKLVKFHKSHGKLVTLTAVRPTARFGELKIFEDQITSFEEKPQLQEGWINGGFFIIEPEFLNFIKSDQTLLEREPLEKVAKDGQLMAYCHDGFWQCMDSKRDKDLLESLASKNPPWIIK